MSLFDNTVARGSVVFVVNSVLETYEVCTNPAGLRGIACTELQPRNYSVVEGSSATLP